MKKKLLIALFASLAVGAFAASKTDTLVVTTNPQMHCMSCENFIKKNIRFVKGTKKIETSVPSQTVTIVYDASKGNFDAYAQAFKKIGYDVKKVEAKKQAASKK
ncbi:MAG: heavy-metal-associated domain-containing protein [Bacteroidales bacterium]|nr:heavy-metal-associated domain-containing protein [Bacteroidales bacterium]